MYSINENDENHQFNIEHVITVMIVIIFCLVFIIFLTILDFYKKPSIYELELLNEFKSSNCSQKNNPCEEEKKEWKCEDCTCESCECTEENQCGNCECMNIDVV